LGKKTRDGPDISTTTLQVGEKAQKSPLTQMTYESMLEKRQLIVSTKSRDSSFSSVEKKKKAPFR
jgi:hypothetical protein